MHHHQIEDKQGYLVELVSLCSDNCHVLWCQDNDTTYDGWDGCHETEFTDYCQSCGVVLPGSTEEVIDTQSTVPGSGVLPCSCQLRNVIVNRFLSPEGEKCEHGNWIQVPMAYIGKG